MATIYRFIVENKNGSGTGEGRKASSGTSKKGAGKKGLKATDVFGSSRGGVEHGRRMRAINPLLNRATNGYWEKSMRLGRAGMGMARNISEKGAKGILAGPAIAIIIALIIQSLLQFQRKQIAIADKQNTQNYKAMENGVSQVHGEYQVTRSFWVGKVNYNENK